MNLNKNDIDFIINLLQESGKIALKYFQSSQNKINIKQDNTPVTLADVEINRLIVSELSKKFPDIGIISEEGDWFSEGEKIFWLVDPIDGTKSFIKGEDEFTINIGLIENQKPVYGFIFAPRLLDGILYYTDENRKAVKYDLSNKKKTFITFKNKKLTLEEILKKPVKIISSSDTELCDISNILQNVKVSHLINMSSSLKFCKMAEGAADIYVHCKETHEWDTAAGHAIILAANGRLKDVDGNDLIYGKTRFLNSKFIVF